MTWIDTVNHWLHLTAAILWIGGTLATSLVVHPALRARLAEDSRLMVYDEIGRRFSRLQWWTWGILAATGARKLWVMRQAPEIFFSSYGYVLAVKLSFVAAMAALSLVHSLIWGPALVSGRGSAEDRVALARKAAFWGKVNGLLMIAIVFCAAVLRCGPF